MKIIDQSYEIISLPDNILRLIEKCGRVCYQSGDKIGCSIIDHVIDDPDFCCGPGIGCDDSQCIYHSSGKFTKMLIDKEHDAMLEFGTLIVKLTTSRAMTHEIVRHRVGMSYAQESQRYVSYKGGIEFIRPVWCDKSMSNLGWKELMGGRFSAAEFQWLHACYQAEQAYQGLLNEGWRPEEAREVLSNSTKTEIVVGGNIRSFRHLFQLRTSKKAHPQIRALMLPLLDELQERVPVVFDDIK